MKYFTKATTSGEMTVREKENLKVAYLAACEGIVMLKNDGVLPFENNKIAAFGPGVSKTIKGGTGSGEVNERHSTSILEGLETIGFEIASKKWLEKYESFYTQKEEAYKKNKFKKINLFKPETIMDIIWDSFQPPIMDVLEEDIAETNTDTCIYVVSRQAGEGKDRRLVKGDYFLSDEEYDNIKNCAQQYKNFVLVINAGACIDMSFVDEIDGINGILFICQPGTEGGRAVADILKGNVTPSGKLTDSWAINYKDIPFGEEYSYLNGNLKDEYYKEGLYVGYRYFDSFDVEPRYPFGYGLSYAEFDIRMQELEVDKTKVSMQVAVTNILKAEETKQFSGKEIVQLYVSAPKGNIKKEFQSLVAFEKTKELSCGEEERLTLSFDIRDVASYRETDHAFVLEAGEYLLRLGESSRNTKLAGVIHIKDEIIVSRHDAICPVKESFDELQSTYHSDDKVENLTILEINADDIKTTIHTYHEPEINVQQEVLDFVNALTVKDMVEIVVGVGMRSDKSRFYLPGSVGNTTSKFWDRGLVNVALCDGPAGVRIQKMSTIEKNGAIKPVELAMSMYESFPKFIKNFMLGNPDKSPVLYQYTTAFPVTAALAQTWNKELLYEVGKSIYREMKEFGCTYWLAPAVNIHRNPLCGRNFEYYSEDPFLTGELATAMAKGVQQEEGYYVTVKHFACNNQEDNRNHVSSNLSERVLREIYLKPFEKVVCAGNAKSVMTSDNRLNGVYTANSYDLCTKVLRNEWNFNGVVMTDWYSTGNTKADDALCMSVGNDLIMPGGIFNKKKILRGIKQGKISENDVRKCCYNVVQSIFNSSTQKEYLNKK